MKSNILFITGTDTGIGKTIATTLLAELLHQMNYRTQVLKPISSGGDEDFQFYSKHLSFRVSPDNFTSYVFKDPISPHLASELEKRPIELERLARDIHNQSQNTDFFIVEGIGGILVPLSSQKTVLDLIQQLQAQIVIVAANKIGVINHTLLTYEACRNRNLEPSGFILNDLPNHQDLSTLSNKKELIRLTKSPCLGHIPLLDLSKNIFENIHQYFKLDPLIACATKPL